MTCMTTVHEGGGGMCVREGGGVIKGNCLCVHDIVHASTWQECMHP